MPASDGSSALELADRLEFDALVLDIGLPHLDGFAVTRTLRAGGSPIRILILTARDTKDDVVHGLDLGADDYLVKPFSFPELIVRLQVLQRSVGPRARCASLTIDPIHGKVARNNIPILLTRVEFVLLLSLSQAGGKTVPRQQLMESVWGKESHIPSNSLDVLVNALRGKLDVPFNSKLISTVRGIGYRLLDDNCRAFDEVVQ